MAFSKSLLLVSLLFAVVLVSSEVVSAHRLLAETTATQNANADGFHGDGHGGHGGHGGPGGRGHGGHGANPKTHVPSNDHGNGGHGNGGHGGRGGHGATAQETEIEN